MTLPDPIPRPVKPTGSPRSQVGRGRAAQPRKAWTVLVWIAGDNSLDSYGRADISEMKTVGSTDAVNIVVQIDRMGEGETLRYWLQKGTSLDADIVETLGETNTGDPEVAIDFFSWGLRQYPSEKVVAVIWNHGSGIDETDIYDRATARGIEVRHHADRSRGQIPVRQIREIAASKLSRALFLTAIDAAVGSKAIAYDDTNKDFLDNAELKRVIAEVVERAGRPIDVLGFDACLMNMIEVSYQLRGLVKHIVGSEEVEPEDGWPYQLVLADLATNPDATGAETAKSIVDRYLRSYPATENVTSSALDLSRVVGLTEAVDGLASLCIDAIRFDSDYAAFGKALNAVQRFRRRDFVDLGDFCRQLAARSARQPLQQAAARVLDLLQGTQPFVVAEGHKGVAVDRATGTAIYFPTAGDVHVAYSQLDFTQETRWGELIGRYQRG